MSTKSESTVSTTEVRALVGAVAACLSDHVPAGYTVDVAPTANALMVSRSKPIDGDDTRARVFCVAEFVIDQKKQGQVWVLPSIDAAAMFSRPVGTSTVWLAAELKPHLHAAIRAMDLHAAASALDPKGASAVEVAVEGDCQLVISVRLSHAQVQAAGLRKLAGVVELMRLLSDESPFSQEKP